MIYVCIPAHNEAATVGLLLWKLRRVLGEFGRDYKIFVWDDASTDGTSEVLARYRRTLPLTVMRSEERIGYARSVERLLREVSELAPYPKRDCAVVLQGDFTERPEDVVSLVKVLEGGADIVAGTLDARRDTHLPRPLRLARRFGRMALGRTWRQAPVSDPVSGLRAYRMIVLRKAFRDRPEQPVVRSDGWAANVELLRLLAPHARRISEAPLELRYDLQVRPSRFHAWRTLLSLVRLRGGAPWGAGAEAA